jgi:hypothetical protein
MYANGIALPRKKRTGANRAPAFAAAGGQPRGSRAMRRLAMSPARENRMIIN